METTNLISPASVRPLALLATLLVMLGCSSSGDKGNTIPPTAPTRDIPDVRQTAETASSGSAAVRYPPALASTPRPTTSPPSRTHETAPASTPTALSLKIHRGSEARYRVKEQLAGRNLPNDAVGVTTDVMGTIAFDVKGQIVAEQSRITVNVSTLKSNASPRDRYIRNSSLESNIFPVALFEARATEGLSWPIPTSGEYTFQLLGEMTMHGVAKPLTWDVIVRFSDSRVTGQAKTSFKFGYFDMTIPRAFIVVSVEDNVQLEIDFQATVETGG